MKPGRKRADKETLTAGSRGMAREPQPSPSTALAVSATSYFDAELLAPMAQLVAASGFVPATELEAKFGPEKTTKGIAILFRQFRMFREARRPWGDKGENVLGYEWADKRFSPSEAKKIPQELGFLLDMGKKVNMRYGGYEDVTVRCRWTNYVLAAIPGEGGKLCFERDMEDRILIPAYSVRAMAKRGLPMFGKELGVAYKIGWHAVYPIGANVKDRNFPVIDDRGQGLGIKVVETLAPGTEFDLTVRIPTSAITVAEWVQFLDMAGRFVHLSPARSSGYGDFEVVKK